MAQLIKWSDEFSVGVNTLDDQHKVLVNLINELYDEIQKQHDDVAVQRIFDKLTEYTHIHFAVEESLMCILNYQNYESHKKQHEKLIASMIDLRNNAKSRRLTMSSELLIFLRSWLTEHILGSDKKYTEHFRSIKPSTNRNAETKHYLWGIRG